MICKQNVSSMLAVGTVGNLLFYTSFYPSFYLPSCVSCFYIHLSIIGIQPYICPIISSKKCSLKESLLYVFGAPNFFSSCRKHFHIKQISAFYSRQSGPQPYPVAITLPWWFSGLPLWPTQQLAVLSSSLSSSQYSDCPHPTPVDT